MQRRTLDQLECLLWAFTIGGRGGGQEDEEEEAGDALDKDGDGSVGNYNDYSEGGDRPPLDLVMQSQQV
jgi:hypothetical protein